MNAPPPPSPIDARTDLLAAAAWQKAVLRTDRLFAGLLAFEWAVGIVLAVWVSPRTWRGLESAVHPHVWAAVALGLAIVSLPVGFVFARPGAAVTRHVVAAGQMFMAGLLIHLTGGRVETHFHVFGSLAFLAFYRDWRVLVTASAVTAADHVARGFLWPESIYGSPVGGAWRWVEHAGWVVFIDLFLVYACVHGRRDLRVAAHREAELEHAWRSLEDRVAERTEELRASQEQFRSSFDHAAIGMALVAPDGRWLQVNRSICTMLGYTEAELLGGRFQDITHPDDLAADLEQVRRLLAGEIATYQLEKRYAHKDGHTVWALLSVSLVRDAAGRPVHFVSQVQDVTQRKAAEDALRATERLNRKLALVASRTTNAVLITGPTKVIEWANQGFTRVTGYAAEEVVGRNAADLLLQRPVAAAARLTVADDGPGQEYENTTKDGRRFWVEVDGQPVWDDAGALTRFVFVANEITTRKQAEAALREAKAAAEDANRAKSEFLANMSHEIRTPMNGILGMTDLVLATDLTPAQRDSLGLVKSSADALLTVINDILDFSKIEAGKLDLDPLPFGLRDVAGDTLKSLAHRAHAKRLELACDVAADVPDAVVGDAGRLRQVLTNLVGNAIKFTDRGEVVLRVELTAAAGGDYVLHFAVRDTGIGIPRHKQAAIFDPFTQADGSTTRRYGGTGLGLTISARLVALMGGRIWVESEPGRGSTFHFEARFGRPRESVERAMCRPVETLDGATVLIVDDNATNRRVLDETVRQWGVVPTCVDGGPAALADLRAAADAGRPFAFVLLDGMMPGMDGLAVAEKIAAEPDFCGASIILLTSADRTGDAARCRELGVTAYLIKPVKAAELHRAILSAMPDRSKPVAALRPEPAAAPPTRPLKILLAEDNAVNQRVAELLLTKLGHAVTIANHGGEAVAAFDREAFDVILMDVQMPEVDGFEATRLIRDRDALAGTHTPIVAMTAHAMKGDRERCLAAGMDEYLTKPVQHAELHRVLAWAAAARDGAAAALAQTPAPAETLPPAPAVFDRGEALARLGGDAELFAEVAGVFRADAPKMLDDVTAAVAAGDAVAARRCAHGLKGAAGYVGGTAVVAAAQRVERLCDANDLSAAADLLPALARDVARLAAALADPTPPLPS